MQHNFNAAYPMSELLLINNAITGPTCNIFENGRTRDEY
jgi:hypothetical protein